MTATTTGRAIHGAPSTTTTPTTTIAPTPATAGPAEADQGSWSGPWACIAQLESGGDPATDTGNGYYGGLQFSLTTWEAYGGVGNPADATAAQQEAVAARVVEGQGWSAWPTTSLLCGDA